MTTRFDDHTGNVACLVFFDYRAAGLSLDKWWQRLCLLVFWPLLIVYCFLLIIVMVVVNPILWVIRGHGL